MIKSRRIKHHVIRYTHSSWIPDLVKRKGLDFYAQKHGYRMGCAFGYSNLKNRKLRRFILENFSIITSRNTMKLTSLISRKATLAAADGMPRFDFSIADRIVSWARTNHVKVRGHVLVYHHEMPEWFFHTDYLEDAPLVDLETMEKRLRSSFEQIIGHFEERFPGTVVCWDVVNEPIADSFEESAAGDPRHIRTSREDAPNLFYKYYGDEYIEKAFLFAREAADSIGSDIGLYINEFNAHEPEKSGYIKALARSVNDYGNAMTENAIGHRRLVSGIGMEGYIGGYGTQKGCLRPLTIDEYEAAMRDYNSCGLDVNITELTVRNFDKSLLARHSEYCKDIFRMFNRINSEGASILSTVIIWGLIDFPAELNEFRYSWNPCGGLLDADCNIKPAYYSIFEALKEPAIKQDRTE